MPNALNLPLNKFQPRGATAPIDPLNIASSLQGGGGGLEAILGQLLGEGAPVIAPPVSIEQQLAEALGQAQPFDNPNVGERARADIPQDPTDEFVQAAATQPTAPTEGTTIPTLEETQAKVQALPADFLEGDLGIDPALDPSFDPTAEQSDIPGLDVEDEKNLFADFFANPETKSLLLGLGIGLLKNEGVGGALERGVAMRQRTIDRRSQQQLTGLEIEKTQQDILESKARTGKLGAETGDIPQERSTENVKAAASLANAEAARISALKKGEITSQDVLKTMTEIQSSIREAQSFGLDEEADALLDSALNINSSVPVDKRHHLPLDAKGESLVLEAAADNNAQRLDELIVIYGPEALEAFATQQGK